jgi:RNA polymerase sigma factor (sigma-70 family)
MRATRRSSGRNPGATMSQALQTDPTPGLISKLQRMLRRRGRSIDDAQDLIQESFLRLHIYSGETDVSQKEAFLVRTALNLSIDQHRRERVAAIVPFAWESLPLVDPQPAPDVVCADRARLRHFRAGLLSLSPRQRDVFCLNRIEGLNTTQVAQHLGLSVSMVEKYATRAMRAMLTWMDCDLMQP